MTSWALYRAPKRRNRREDKTNAQIPRDSKDRAKDPNKIALLYRQTSSSKMSLKNDFSPRASIFDIHPLVWGITSERLSASSFKIKSRSRAPVDSVKRWAMCCPCGKSPSKIQLVRRSITVIQPRHIRSDHHGAFRESLDPGPRSTGVSSFRG